LKINGKIVVQTLPAGTKFTTLDDIERTLHEEDLMICDEKGPLCIGVLVEKIRSFRKYQCYILESAYFNPVSIQNSKETSIKY
jgi:phenylalanyl-tRNA synthetase beta chain